MSLHQTGSEYITAVAKASPAVAVVAAEGAGLTLGDWVLIATLIYTVLQTAHLIYKFIEDRRNGSQRD